MLNTYFKVFIVVNQLTLLLLGISIDRHLEEIKYSVNDGICELNYVIQNKTETENQNEKVNP
jgi:hypothetical protein